MNDNKLIAEFMGYPPMTDAVDDRTIAYDVGGSVMNINNTHNENDDNVFHPDDMKFHTSWDWLMPVVEKIESLGYWVNRNDGDITISNKSDMVVVTPMSSGGIDMMYKAVVEFIKEVNELT